jgi:glutamine synthetase
MRSGVSASIGLEQEFFLVPREQYYRRLDLQMTGRTVMGNSDNTICPRGQEMCDHYMAPINQVRPKSSSALDGERCL